MVVKNDDVVKNGSSTPWSQSIESCEVVKDLCTCKFNCIAERSFIVNVWATYLLMVVVVGDKGSVVTNQVQHHPKEH
jgi:hypothetical protein